MCSRRSVDNSEIVGSPTRFALLTGSVSTRKLLQSNSATASVSSSAVSNGGAEHQGLNCPTAAYGHAYQRQTRSMT